ncbi:MAG: right-handed parallel beta-helix repeat-containing protein [bacterium]|nr:right-handed parallel beta-helix repeat-containing protein [bacterium]
MENRLAAARIADNEPIESILPPSNLLSDSLYYWRVTVRNVLGETHGPVWQFTTGFGPLAGSYAVGAGGEFASLQDALSAIQITGIGGSTTLTLSGGVYDAPLVIPPIAGAGESSRLTITAADSLTPPLLCSASATDSSGVIFDGASWVTLRRVHIACGAGAKHAVLLRAGARASELRDAVITGPGASVASGSCVFLAGGSGDDNVIANLHLRGAMYGIRIESPEGSRAQGNEIRDCRIDSVQFGVQLIRQADCRVRGCDIDPNAGSYNEVNGIRVGTTLPGDTIFIHHNQIDQVTTAGVYAVGIRVKTDSAAAVVRLYDNVLFDFRPSGSAQTRALFISSGRVDATANSILIGDLSASGAAYAVYHGALAAQGSLLLRNSILANLESSNTAYNVFCMSAAAALMSDHNVFFGTGSNYRLGRWGSDQSSLAAWQLATAGDAHSLEGDPGFVAATDLHLTAASELAHQNGAVVSYLTDDIDGDARRIPPDRGADEYEFAAPAADLAVIAFLDLQESYSEQHGHVLRAVVQNRGSAAQVGVPVELRFEGDWQDEATVSLAPLACDTVSLTWFTPAAPDTGRLEVRCFLSGDARPPNDSLSAIVAVVSSPLAGTYLLGGTNADFATFAQATAALQTRGVSEPVTFLVRSGVYGEQVTLPLAVGASPECPIHFQPEESLGVVQITTAQIPATVVFNEAHYVTLDGFSIQTISPNVTGALFSSNSDSNAITRCTFTGNWLDASTSSGIRVFGGGNHGNRVSDVTIGGFYYGIRAEGLASAPDTGTCIENCAITTSRTAIRMAYEHAALIRGNQIQTGYPGATGACYGVYLGTGSAGQTVTVDGNAFVGGRGAAACCAIYSVTGNGTAILRNNMIAGWNVTGGDPVYGILIGGGTADVLFNSLWMNDVPGSGPVIGIADSGSAIVTVRNNVCQVSEAQNPAWCLSHLGQTLVSDFNAFHPSAINPLLRLGRWHTADAPALADWQTLSLLDASSVWGDPGFRDSLDLHVRIQAPLLSGRGQALASVTADFDDDARNDPPDIGADEYRYSATAVDCGAAWAEIPEAQYSAGAFCPMAIRVVNFGAYAVDSLHVSLSFDDDAGPDTVIALEAETADTVLLSWRAPDVELRTGLLIARCATRSDVTPQNDSVAAEVRVAGLPLSGRYVVGMDPLEIVPRQFATLAEAVDHLHYRGVNRPVTLEMSGGEHAGPLQLTEIPGASADHPIVLRGSVSEASPSAIRSESGAAAVNLCGTDYISFEHLHIQAAGSCTTAVSLSDSACDNRFFDCEIVGADSSNLHTAGLRIASDGSGENLFENLTISGAFYGIVFSGGSGDETGRGNIVRGCRVRHARYGIHVARQTDGLIESNDVQPGSLSGVAAACYGIYVTGLGDGGSVTIRGNVIHDFADGSGSVSNRAVGVFAAPTVGASALICNNFVYGFANAGSLRINPFYLSSGEISVVHNSVRMDHAGAEAAAVYISTGSGHVLKNNIFMSCVENQTSCGILQAAGSGLVCDGNDIFGASPLFVVGQTGGVSYPTFTAWQAAGYDPAGLSADPVFRGSHDLHILETADVVNGRGVACELVTTDIDGEPRENPPDIGADEYLWQSEASPVQELRIFCAGTDIVLAWNRAAGAGSYHVYAGSTPGFPLDEGNRIATVSDTTFTTSAVEFPLRFYMVTSDDAPIPATTSPEPVQEQGDPRRE